MSDFFEIDVLSVEAKKSGDAICVRYAREGNTTINVVDAGFQSTGPSVVDHIRKHYDNPTIIQNVVVTHPDGDHAGGVPAILEAFEVDQLWMHRPWKWAEQLLDRFETCSTVEGLRRRLKQAYPTIAAIEELAESKGIPIFDPFQGAKIGEFTVMAPTMARYFDLVVESEKTPEATDEEQVSVAEAFGTVLVKAAQKVVNFVLAAWGVEVFSPEPTSAENEMSVIQYAYLCGEKILLTGDAGREALAEAAEYAPYVGLILPGIDRFQVPHHGSRRNVSTELLDQWLGTRLAAESEAKSFTAFISSAKEDKDHPRKAVVRAMIHRGGRVFATEGAAFCNFGGAAPYRGWGPATACNYPNEQEE